MTFIARHLVSPHSKPNLSVCQAREIGDWESGLRLSQNEGMKSSVNKINRLTQAEYQQWLNDKASFGQVDSPFGVVSLCFDSSGVSRLSFGEDAFDEFGANLLRDNDLAQRYVDEIFSGCFSGQLILMATDFELIVWRTAMAIKFGETVSYQALAERIGKPKSFRSVASAIAKNRCGMLIPCHRVIKKSGELGEFRWGREMKSRLLDWESHTKR